MIPAFLGMAKKTALINKLIQSNSNMDLEKNSPVVSDSFCRNELSCVMA